MNNSKNINIKNLATIAMFCAASLFFIPFSYAQDRSEEYQLKAVLLSRLMQFVTWPESLDPQARSFCVIGTNPFANSLDESFANQEIDVTYIEDSEAGIETCKIIFFAESQLRSIPNWLAQLEGLPVLTVSDIPRFALSGGMINLTFENRRVRFRINKAVADAADLNLSFQLLNLSDLVETSVRGDD